MNRVWGLFLSMMLAFSAAPASAEEEQFALPARPDPAKWQYNAEDDVYWQTGIAYCASPVNRTYETVGIFVPGAYMDAVDNGDGTFTCTVKPQGEKAGYTAETAPIVIPVDTPGYSAMKAPDGYVSGVSAYTDAGFVYYRAGCRGTDSGAPWGITDLKAAVRYLRYSSDVLPGSTDRIFTFGMSGGGAQSALMGATGNSALYEPYLRAIGAVDGYSDAVAGSMCWCPITNLDTADEAYEWNMGVSRTNLTGDMQALSDSLASAYTDYINALGLTNSEGVLLTLDGKARGVEDTGTYITQLTGLVEESLNNFLADTQFPYAPVTGKGGAMDIGDADRAGGFSRMGEGRGELPGDQPGNPPEPDGGMKNAPEGMDGVPEGMGGALRPGEENAKSTAYETPADYIAALNGDAPWIDYDSETGLAHITSLAGFVKACKPATKNVGAFDDLSRTQTENILFGVGDGQGLHFDPIMASLLEGTADGEAFAGDLAQQDSLGTSMAVRMNMYNPMYYISPYYEGCGTAQVAQYWRIRTGITQGDTALNTEMNLALALEAYGTEVDFATVWNQGHVEAERTGTSTENFIQWVNGCLSE